MPITWKNVAAPSFTGAAASLAGASDSFKNAGEALTAAFKGPLEDRRNAEEDARTQAAHTLAQELGRYEVNAAAFDQEHQAEIFGLDKANKLAQIGARNRQFTGTSAKGSAASDKIMQTRMAEQITRAHTDPKTGKIKRMLALNEAARVGVSMEYMDKSIKQTYASSGNKLADEAKKAKNKDYKGIKYKEAPKDLTSHYLDLGTTDDEARSIWSRQYQKLRSADANDAEARNSLDQGTDYGIFETTWGNTELIDKDIADFQARKEMRAKKYR